MYISNVGNTFLGGREDEAKIRKKNETIFLIWS
jgi:hypothetical protein